MALIGLHEITVLANNDGDRRIMLAAIVERTARNRFRINDTAVQIGMQERGREILYGDEDIREAMAGNARLNEFAIEKALENPMQIPQEMELALRAENKYCGRLRFRCMDIPENLDDLVDVMLIILNENSREENLEQHSRIILNNCKWTAIVAAVVCTEPPGENDDPKEAFDRILPEFGKKLKERKFFCGWYNPYGFSSGVLRSTDNPQPFGVEDIFLKTLGYAAEVRTDFLRRSAEKSLEVIKSRRSIFQRDSVRRMIELEKSRVRYSCAVKDIYASEQLLALTKGRTAESGN